LHCFALRPHMRTIASFAAPKLCDEENNPLTASTPGIPSWLPGCVGLVARPKVFTL
jgi:hypothetical protein